MQEATPQPRGKILYVVTHSFPFFKTYMVKDSDNKTVLYKAKIRTSGTPYIQLRSSGNEIGWAVYANDDLESCTTINLQGQQFEVRWDNQDPIKGVNSQYWPSPTFKGTRLTWNFTDMRTNTCCIEGDVEKPVAVMRWTLSITDVGQIEILDDWPAGDINEIVMLALVTFQRRTRMLTTTS